MSDLHSPAFRFSFSWNLITSKNAFVRVVGYPSSNGHGTPRTHHVGKPKTRAFLALFLYRRQSSCYRDSEA